MSGCATSQETKVDTVAMYGQPEVERSDDLKEEDEEFIEEVTEGLLPPPKYFPLNVQMNKEGYDDFQDVLKRSAKALSPHDFEAAANETEAI